MELGQDIWLFDGTTLDLAGFKYPTRMAVIRLENGELVVWSPIEASDALLEAVGSLGKVAHFIAPNAYHHLFLREWIRAFPAAKLYAPASFSKRHHNVYVDEVLENFDFHGEILMFCYPTKHWDEAVIYHVKSRTMIFADVLQCLPRSNFDGWRKWVAILNLITGELPAVPRKTRFFTERKKARKAVKAMLALPTENIVIAHGSCVFGQGKAVLVKAFEWLSPSAS